MVRMRVTIDGMTCDHCVGAIRQALRAMNGVTVERVDVGSAEVTYDPNMASPQDIIDAVGDAGYAAQTADAGNRS